VIYVKDPSVGQQAPRRRDDRAKRRIYRGPPWRKRCARERSAHPARARYRRRRDRTGSEASVYFVGGWAEDHVVCGSPRRFLRDGSPVAGHAWLTLPAVKQQHAAAPPVHAHPSGGRRSGAWEKLPSLGLGIGYNVHMEDPARTIMPVSIRGVRAATWPTPKRRPHAIGSTSWLRHPPGERARALETSRESFTASCNANFAQSTP